MPFPEIIFGRCPVCGGKGTDDAASGSQHSTEDHTGAGYNLLYYEGQLMCKMCKKRLRNDEESRQAEIRRNEEQVFRDKLGFKRNMAD